MSRGAKPGERRGGRVKGVPNHATADIKALARKYGPAALQTLESIMQRSESDAAKVAAAKELLDRGHGKAPQDTTTTIKGVQYVIHAPMPAESPDQWLEAYAPIPARVN